MAADTKPPLGQITNTNLAVIVHQLVIPGSGVETFNLGGEGGDNAGGGDRGSTYAHREKSDSKFNVQKIVRVYPG